MCWLAVLQRQKDNTLDMVRTGERLPEGQSILQENFQDRMGSELVRHCDNMERHGLVDYEMGVWEEEIMSSTIATQFSSKFFLILPPFFGVSH
jgi:hypothetical protein